MKEFEEEASGLIYALDGYFNGAGGDKSWNKSLALPIIQSYGGASVIGGLAWVVNDIKLMSVVTVSKAFSIPGDALNNFVVARLMTTMSYMHNFIQACGEKGQEWLIESIPQYHEDVRALAAYFLADDRWKLNSQEKIERVKHAVEYTEGTSCKIALSLALFMAGDRQLLRSFLAKEYFGSQDRYHKICELAKQANPKTNRDDIEMFAVLFVVVPEIFEYSLADAGLLKMLALDIESNGRSCKAIPDWKRKQYAE